MTSEILIDSSAWGALLNANDRYHSLAAQTYPRLLSEYQRIVMTNFLVSEAYILLLTRIGRPYAIEFLDKIRSSSRIYIVTSSPALESTAEAILRHYSDQDFSYTDAVSFALMQVRGIRQAFSFDHHFAVMGFECLPNI